MLQISKGQYDRVWAYIEAGKQEGAKPILGGVKRTGKGFFVDPTSRCSKNILFPAFTVTPTGSLHRHPSRYENSMAFYHVIIT